MVRVNASRETFFKTKKCPHLAIGACRKGADCFYAHSDAELRQPPNLRKTRLCDAYMRGSCMEGENCSFAHGERDLRTTDSYFKTDLCKYWKAGKCHAGKTCRHAHGIEELRARKFQESELEKMRHGSSLAEIVAERTKAALEAGLDPSKDSFLRERIERDADLLVAPDGPLPVPHHFVIAPSAPQQQFVPLFANPGPSGLFHGAHPPATGMPHPGFAAALQQQRPSVCGAMPGAPRVDWSAPAAPRPVPQPVQPPPPYSSHNPPPPPAMGTPGCTFSFRSGPLGWSPIPHHLQASASSAASHSAQQLSPGLLATPQRPPTRPRSSHTTAASTPCTQPPIPLLPPHPVALEPLKEPLDAEEAGEEGEAPAPLRRCNSAPTFDSPPILPASPKSTAANTPGAVCLSPQPLSDPATKPSPHRDHDSDATRDPDRSSPEVRPLRVAAKPARVSGARSGKPRRASTMLPGERRVSFALPEQPLSNPSSATTSPLQPPLGAFRPPAPLQQCPLDFLTPQARFVRAQSEMSVGGQVAMETAAAVLQSTTHAQMAQQQAALQQLYAMQAINNISMHNAMAVDPSGCNAAAITSAFLQLQAFGGLVQQPLCQTQVAPQVAPCGQTYAPMTPSAVHAMLASVPFDATQLVQPQVYED